MLTIYLVKGTTRMFAPQAAVRAISEEVAWDNYCDKFKARLPREPNKEHFEIITIIKPDQDIAEISV